MLLNCKVMLSELQLAVFRLLVIKFELDQRMSGKLLKILVIVDLAMVVAMTGVGFIATHISGNFNLQTERQFLQALAYERRFSYDIFFKGLEWFLNFVTATRSWLQR